MAACLALVHGLAGAQAARPRPLSAPNATLDTPFSRVASVRELANDQVVVIDDLEIALWRVNLSTGATVALGRVGRGPGEFTLLQRLVALPGDSTMAIEMGGGGMALLLAGASVSTERLQARGVPRGEPLFTRSSVQADARGRLYEEASLLSTATGPVREVNAIGIRRFDRQTGRQDTLGELVVRTRSPLLSDKPVLARGASSSMEAAAGISKGPPPYASVDQWAVAPDGRIAITTVDPYQVTFVAPDGTSAKGPVIAYTPVRVNAAEKARWQELSLRPGLMLTYTRAGGMVGGRSVRPYVEPEAWPAVLPPFLKDATRFAPDGTLWVERLVPAGEPQTFDLIGRDGRVMRQVVLPAGARLVGFGARTVYTVRIDEDDLEYLQRHAMP